MIQDKEVVTLEKAMKAVNAEALRLRVEFKKTLYLHMAQVLGRKPEDIYRYSFERWQMAYRQYKKILKDRRK